MPREIKFRAWDKTYKNWFKASLKSDGWTTHDTAVEQTDGEVTEWQQFTGLLDKNGREIFEGDIVQSRAHSPSVMEVKFIEGGFCCDWGDSNFPIDINHFYPSTGCQLEVIGNVHEYPHLLTPTK